MFSDSKRRLLRTIGKRLIAVALVFLGIFILVDMSLRPIVETINAYQCRLMVTDLINTAVSEELQREDICYSKLVELQENHDGEIVSVQSNVLNINHLKTNISSRLDRELQRISAIEIGIPVGTLLGIQLLHGKGFDVGMTVHPVGYAATRIISEFTEAGINQTRHRIIIEIKASLDAVIPGFSSDVTVVTSIVAAETVIIGRVPDAYTHVVSSDSDLVGTLEDYEAETY